MDESVYVDLRALLDDGIAEGLYSGAIAAVSLDGARQVVCVGTHAFDDETPVRPASLFDLASVTKTITAAAIVRLAEMGRLQLDDEVASIHPIGGRDSGVTMRHLLTHTAGLPAESAVWRELDLTTDQRRERVLAAPLLDPPDAVHRYSCVGYVAAGHIAEKVSGSSLDDLVNDLIVAPLNLPSIRFGPVERSLAVATEEQPWVGRGLVRGEVHDELSWFLGGLVGNAGLFATAPDLLGFVESLLDDRLFGDRSRLALTTNALRPRHGSAYGQALGARIGDREIGAVDGCLGHPGFTGTMWLAAPDRGIAAVLLTNRVHPHRDRVDLSGFRRRFSAAVLRSVA